MMGRKTGWKQMCRAVCRAVPAVALLLLALPKGKAQADIHFSQFYENTLLRNPALVGVSEDNYKFLGYFREQWSSVANPYQTVALTAEYRVSLKIGSPDCLSFGLLAFNDHAGDVDQKITAVYPALNFNKYLGPNHSYLSFGFTGGYQQYSFDQSKATFDHQFIGGVFSVLNPTGENLPNPRFGTFDLGAGANYNFTAGANDNASFLFGVSAFHLTQPAFTYYVDDKLTEEIRWNINAGMITDLSDHAILQLHLDYAKQGEFTELIGGGLLGWKSFSVNGPPAFEFFAGLFYRVGDAVIPTVKMKYKDLSLGISYDANVSELQPASDAQGGYEVTLCLTGNYPKNPATVRQTVCPRF